MKNRISLWALGLLFTALFLMPQAWGATCTNASFSGTYAYNEAGVFLFATANVGTLTADGAGNFTFSEAAFNTLFPGSLLGGGSQLSNETATGTYIVNGDCTFTLTFHPSNMNCYSHGPCLFPIHFDGVLVRGATAFYIIATDPVVQGSGAGIKI